MTTIKHMFKTNVLNCQGRKCPSLWGICGQTKEHSVFMEFAITNKRDTTLYSVAARC
jgi:hypothetical protein